MSPHELATLQRDCEATRIPYGDKMTLHKGLQVEITQSLGGTYTVMTEDGAMVSIAAKDADALGRETAPRAEEKAEEKAGEKAAESLSFEDQVWHQLKKCYDPEIPHNIVDLGLIYGCEFSNADPDGKNVHIRMTLTAPGCGMGDWLKQDVAEKVKAVPGVKDVMVDVVFEPPWDQSRINPKLKPYLGM